MITDLERRAAQQRADLVHVDASSGSTRRNFNRIAFRPGRYVGAMAGSSRAN
jgi:hypothetical protein